jgi:CubicO group peptidase (beta-lactamase class C family)
VTLDTFLPRLQASGLVTAAAGLVARGEDILWRGASGWERGSSRQPASIDTRFDLASLTKPFTATLALRLDASGRLPLDLRIGEIWPRAHPELARRPLSALLRHRAGLGRWAPLYQLCGDRKEVPELLLGGQLLGARAGTYSDLDFILWGLAAEEVLHISLAELLRMQVTEPLELSATGPPPGEGVGVAECVMDTDVERRLAEGLGLEIDLLGSPQTGSVQDGNSRFVGSPAGHAGLFSTAPDLWYLASEWLQPGRLLTARGVEGALSGRGRFALGWERRRLRGSAGEALSRSAFGHTGFTGGNLWVDPATGLIAVLLAHRRDPFSDLDQWRRKFHREAAKLAA